MNNKKKYCDAKIFDVKYFSSDVSRIRMRIDQSLLIKFKPGMYVPVTFCNQTIKYLSIGNYPLADGYLEFFVKEEPSLIEELWDTVAELSHPGGSATLEECSGSKVLLLAMGCGIAQTRSLLESYIRTDESLPKLSHNIKQLVIYWGVKTSSDLYLRSYFESIEQNHSNVSFRFATSREGASCYVQELIVEDFSDLKGVDVVVSGSKQFALTAKEKLDRHFDNVNSYFSDQLNSIHS